MAGGVLRPRAASISLAVNRLRLQIIDRFLAHLRPDLLLDVGAHLLERLRFALLDQNQVIPVGCFNGFGDLPDGRREHHFIKLRHHLPRTESPQIAAILARPGVVGFCLGLILELRARGDLGTDFFGLRERFCVR